MLRRAPDGGLCTFMQAQAQPMQQNFHPAMAEQQQQPDYSAAAAMPYGQQPQQQYDAMAYQQVQQQYGQPAAPYQPAGYGGDPAYGVQQGPPMQVMWHCSARVCRQPPDAAVADADDQDQKLAQVGLFFGLRPICLRLTRLHCCSTSHVFSDECSPDGIVGLQAGSRILLGKGSSASAF